MYRVCSLAAIALAAGACDRPTALVLCHNANCAGLADRSRDDTEQALRASLALQFDGRPLIDGVELDTFWHGAEGRCVWTHDLSGNLDQTPLDAADILAEHLASPGPVAWNGERFYLFIELKGFVGESFDDKHTPAQREMHAACALDFLRIVSEGATAGGHRLEVAFTTTEPALMRALLDHSEWPDPDPTGAIEVRLAGDIGIPRPITNEAPRLSEYATSLGVSIMEYSPYFIIDGQVTTYRDLGLDLAQWSFITTPEVLDAIERYEPRYVITSEAAIVRGWLER